MSIGGLAWLYGITFGLAVLITLALVIVAARNIK